MSTARVGFDHCLCGTSDLELNSLVSFPQYDLKLCSPSPLRTAPWDQVCCNVPKTPLKKGARNKRSSGRKHKAQPFLGPNYSRAFPRPLKFSLSIQDRLWRSGFEFHLTFNGGLRALLLGEGEDALFAACPVLWGKMLLLSATEPSSHRLGLI